MSDHSRSPLSFDYGSLKHVAQAKSEHTKAQWHIAASTPGAGAGAGAGAAAQTRARRYLPTTSHLSAANDAAIVKDAVEAVEAASAGVIPGSQFVCDKCDKPIHSGTLFARHESTSSVDTHYYASVPAAKKMCGPCGNKIIVLQANRDKWELHPFRK
jgi:hypothetical protein